MYAEVLPVIAKTNKIIKNCTLEVIPHFIFNRFIAKNLKCKITKFNLVAPYSFPENKASNDITYNLLHIHNQ